MAIEEAKDVRKMKLEELIGSLRTFAMKLEEEKGGKKAQEIAFKPKVMRRGWTQSVIMMILLNQLL